MYLHCTVPVVQMMSHPMLDCQHCTPHLPKHLFHHEQFVNNCVRVNYAFLLTAYIQTLRPHPFSRLCSTTFALRRPNMASVSACTLLQSCIATVLVSVCMCSPVSSGGVCPLVEVCVHLSLVEVCVHLSLVEVCVHLSLVEVCVHLSLVEVCVHLSLVEVCVHLSLVEVYA